MEPICKFFFLNQTISYGIKLKKNYNNNNILDCCVYNIFFLNPTISNAIKLKERYEKSKKKKKPICKSPYCGHHICFISFLSKWIYILLSILFITLQSIQI